MYRYFQKKVRFYLLGGGIASILLVVTAFGDVSISYGEVLGIETEDPSLIAQSKEAYPNTFQTIKSINQTDKIELSDLINPSPTPTQIPTPTITPYPTYTPAPTNSIPTGIPTQIPEPVVESAIAQQQIPYESHFDTYARAYGIDKSLLIKIARCESGFNPNATNGPYAGMYQYLAATWQSTRNAMGENPDPALRTNPEEAIKTSAWKIAHGGIGAWPVCGK